jgi:hypothetical protein
MMLWQEIAENFYPERADFTVVRNLGDDYASHLSTSYPLLCRRDLGDQIGRDAAADEQAVVPHGAARHAHRGQRSRAGSSGPRARSAGRCTTAPRSSPGGEGGRPRLRAFGQCVESVELNRFRSALLYRCWHLKDVVWRENQDGEIDFVARKWRVALVDLIRYFPKAELDPRSAAAAKEPFAEIVVMHIVCAAELWDGMYAPRQAARLDLLRLRARQADRGGRDLGPHLPHLALADRVGQPVRLFAGGGGRAPRGRLLQAMTLTLLEAGEKAVNPPLIATKDAVKSDMQQFPGGVTWVDAEYDEKLGAALRAMNIDVKGLPISLEMVKDSRACCSSASS